MSDGGQGGVSTDVKKVHIYSNGDKFFAGRRFVINPRTSRNFGALLTQVTDSLKPAFGAVRTLRTPDHGSEINDISQLQSGCSYVACDRKFVPLGYKDISFAQKPRNQPSPQRRPKVVASGRIKRIDHTPVSINVYTNGEPLDGARRVLLKPWVQRTWETVLVAINEKVNLRTGAVRHLIELSDGRPEVCEGVHLKNNEYYVAVGSERFKDLDYGAIPLLSPRQQQKKKYPSLAPLKKKNRSNASTDGASSTSNQSSLESSANSGHPDEKTPKPKRRAVAQQPAKEEGIPVKPIKHTRGSGDKSKQEEPKPQKPESDRKRPPRKNDQKKEVDMDKADVDRDDSGVYKSRGKKQKAAEVRDDKRVKTEVPIDKREAEEIEDETSDQEEQSPKAEPSPPAKSPSKSTNRSQPKSDNTNASPEPVEREKTLTPRQQTPSPPPKEKSPSPPPKQRSLTPETEQTPTPTEQDSPTPDSANEDAAATKIQSSYRGYKTRKELKEKRDAKSDEQQEENEEENAEPTDDDKKDAAAIKIQAQFRGYQVRKNMEKPDDEADEKKDEPKDTTPTPAPKDEEDKEKDNDKAQDEAATKIQASYRGYKTRKELKQADPESDSEAKREGDQPEESEAQPSSTEKDDDGVNGDGRDPDLENAAVKIQANYRGYRSRKQNPATKESVDSSNDQMQGPSTLPQGIQTQVLFRNDPTNSTGSGESDDELAKEEG